MTEIDRTFFVDLTAPGIVRCVQDPTIGYLAGSFAVRMVQCLNACAGVEDPPSAQQLTKMKGGL